MWTTILFNIAISIIIIVIAHHLWEYCKTNYTSQKTKNLIEIHASKYKQIAEDMERNTSIPVPPPPLPNTFLREDEKLWIQTELASFLETI